MPVSTHVETTIVPGRRLGLRPRDPSRPVLKLGKYLTGRLPVHPPAVDYFTRIGTRWCLGANNRFSTCGPTALANLVVLDSTWLGDKPVVPADQDVFWLYRHSGNPDFDPETGAGDNGVEMTVMLSAALKYGIAGVYPLAFAEVRGDQPDEIWAASALFGATLWAADLSTAQQQDTGMWDYHPGAPAWGGHAVLAGGRYTDQPGTRTDLTGLVSWAEELDATDLFVQRQVSGRYVVIFPWHLKSKTFMEGIDIHELAADYELLTGRPFPSVPDNPPAPAPVPAPENPDRVLVRELGPWSVARHIGSNADAARSFLRWRDLKGL